MFDVFVFSCLWLAGEASAVLVGSPLSLWPVAPVVLQQRTQWFLSSCTGHWFSSVIAVCRGHLSRCGVQARLSLWIIVTLFEARGSLYLHCTWVSSCDVILLQVVVVITVVAVCKGLLSCCGVLSNQVYLLIFLNFFFSFIYISWRLITLQYYSGFCYTLT